MAKVRKHRALTAALIVLTVLQLAFIFGQSLLDAPSSSGESGSVLDFVKPFFELFVGKGNVTETLVRKCAHITEFAVLGALSASLSFVIGKRRPLHFVFVLLCTLAAAVTDESIQLLSPGRSGEIRDVLIDVSGAVSGIVLTLAVIFIIIRIKGRGRHEKQSDS